MTTMTKALKDLLTEQEFPMCQEMLSQWSGLITKNKMLSNHYNGKINVKSLGMAIPPALQNKIKAGMQWSNQAVRRISDISVIDGFSFSGDTPAGFEAMMSDNDFIGQYEETTPSQLTHGCSFWTVTAGDTDKGEPPVVIASYDALHATALYDYRHRRTLCGLVIVDVDVRNPKNPIAFNFYAPNGDIVETWCDKAGNWTGRRLHTSVGRCLMEVMRNDPDKEHPFGNSVISPSIMSLEDQANSAFVRLICTSEFAASIQRWVMGADDSMFDGDAWNQLMGGMLLAPVTDTTNEVLPQVGQFPQIDTSPQIKTIRELASLFAAEASIPIHSLLYTEANPASAEAIEASRYDLVLKAERVNMLNGATIRNIVMLALSIIQEKPASELGDVERSFTVQWKNPRMASLAASADAATKIASEVPGFAGTTTYWRMLGFDAKQAEGIRSEINSAVSIGARDEENRIKFSS